MTPDIRIVNELRACAATWEPDARLLGNVTAGQVVAVCDAALAAFDAGACVAPEVRAAVIMERQRLAARLERDVRYATPEWDALLAHLAVLDQWLATTPREAAA